MQKEIKRLMNEWNISENQAKLLTIGFENENLDGPKFYDIMNSGGDKIIDLVVAKDVVKNYGINNVTHYVLHLSGFEEYMNDCLSEQSELQRTYTEHPYLNHETNEIEYPNCEKSTDDICVSLLEQCKEAGDDANSKLAKKTLEKVKIIGVEKAMEEMAVNCFKHPETGRPLSYSEMRSLYG